MWADMFDWKCWAKMFESIIWQSTYYDDNWYILVTRQYILLYLNLVILSWLYMQYFNWITDTLKLYRFVG